MKYFEKLANGLYGAAFNEGRGTGASPQKQMFGGAGNAPGKLRGSRRSNMPLAGKKAQGHAVVVEGDRIEGQDARGSRPMSQQNFAGQGQQIALKSGGSQDVGPNNTLVDKTPARGARNLAGSMPKATPIALKSGGSQDVGPNNTLVDKTPARGARNLAGSMPKATPIALKSGGSTTAPGGRAAPGRTAAAASRPTGRSGPSAFGRAFAGARKSGQKAFDYKGKSYHTRQKGESQSQWAGAISRGQSAPAKASTATARSSAPTTTRNIAGNSGTPGKASRPTNRPTMQTGTAKRAPGLAATRAPVTQAGKLSRPSTKLTMQTNRSSRPALASASSKRVRQTKNIPKA